MNTIYIIGSGGFAKEVYYLIKSLEVYEVQGFIGLNTSILYLDNREINVIQEDDFINSSCYKDANLALGVGDPKLIAKIVGKFDGFRFPNIISPHAICENNSIVMGRGNIVTHGVVMTTSISIGNYNVFNLNSTIGHDVVIGNCNVVNPSVNVSGGVTIGSCNLLGVSSCVLQYKNIGNNSIVGASSLVTKDVDDNTTVIGVPARVKK